MTLLRQWLPKILYLQLNCYDILIIIKRLYYYKGKIDAKREL